MQKIKQDLVARLSEDLRVKSIHSIVAVGKPNVTRFIVTLYDIVQTPEIPEDILEGAPIEVIYISNSAVPPKDSTEIYNRLIRPLTLRNL